MLRENKTYIFILWAPPFSCGGLGKRAPNAANSSLETLHSSNLCAKVPSVSVKPCENHR